MTATACFLFQDLSKSWLIRFKCNRVNNSESKIILWKRLCHVRGFIWLIYLKHFQMDGKRTVLIMTAGMRCREQGRIKKTLLTEELRNKGNLASSDFINLKLTLMWKDNACWTNRGTCLHLGFSLCRWTVPQQMLWNLLNFLHKFHPNFAEGEICTLITNPTNSKANNELTLLARASFLCATELHCVPLKIHQWATLFLHYNKHTL